MRVFCFLFFFILFTQLSQVCMILEYITKIHIESKGVSCSVVSDSCDPTDCSSLGSSVRGILQGRMLTWIAIPFSRGSSRSRD